MRYIKTFDEQRVDEGLKSWVSSFLILTTLGLVPPSIALSQDKKEKKEFVDNLAKDKLDAALFVDYLNSQGDNKLNLDSLFSKFKSTNTNVKSNLKDVNKFINKSGRKYIFDQKYIVHDYSGIDITKFQADNWLMDMGNMIADEQEPAIDNWISDYERLTSVEISIITIDKLPDGQGVADYALEQFNRLGVGKYGADNGVVIVLSKSDREWNITTGRGIEGILPDITCSDIGNENIVPHFKEQDYYGGIMEALERIKSVIGKDQIELKKDWLKKKKDKEDQESRLFWESFWQTTLELLILALVIYLIIYTVNAKKRKARELKEMKDNIDSLISKINNLKSNLPQSIDIKSNSLNSIFNSCKQYFNSITIDTGYNKDIESKMDSIYNKMKSSLSDYRAKLREIEEFKKSTEMLDSIEFSAYSDIEDAIQNADKIQKYGYASPAVPSKNEIDVLHTLIPQILELMFTNIDNAMDIYKKYTSSVSSVLKKGSNVASTLASIENSISRIKNWEKEVNDLMPDFEKASGNEETLLSLISEFKSKLKSTKDWFILCKELDRIINYMESEIQEYEERERRKREAEEERRAAVRREEQRRDDERRAQQRRDDDNRSSSSFSGFGGGSSGGGGASGSW